MRLCWVLLLLLSSLAEAGEYFLDGAQRKELLLYGRITGRDQAQYDIWVVPGYVPPSRHIETGWRAAGKDLQEYRKPEYFRQMKKSTRDVMRYARHEVLAEFALQGTGTAWREASVAAQERVRRRVFGWWLAWPWAVVEASAESVVRVGGGIPGGAALWAGGAVVTPLVYLAVPAGMSIGHALGEGVAYPLSAASWNTLVAPPLALAGEQPSAERADGWWMTRLQDPAEADIRARLAAWQHGWQDDPVLAGQRAALVEREAGHRARMAGLQQQLQAEQAAWTVDEARLREDFRRAAIGRAQAALPALDREMAAQGYPRARLESQREVLLAEMVAQGLDRETAGQVLAAWLSGVQAVPSRQAGDKTDPVRQVLDPR